MHLRSGRREKSGLTLQGISAGRCGFLSLRGTQFPEVLNKTFSNWGLLFCRKAGIVIFTSSVKASCRAPLIQLSSNLRRGNRSFLS